MLPAWVWLVIIIVIILIVWWAISRSAEEETIEVMASPKELEPEPLEPDDLAILEGIGPKVNTLLQGAGFSTFAQLADANLEDIKELLEVNGLQFLDPSTWPEQAKLASEGNMEELHALQDQLKGGRQV